MRINSGVADQDIRLILCTGSSTLEEVRRLHASRLHAFVVFAAGHWPLSISNPLLCLDHLASLLSVSCCL